MFSARVDACYNQLTTVPELSQEKGSSLFEEQWKPLMQPVVLKLLNQESVTQKEWQDLFQSVHAVCIWDEKGAPKVREALEKDILDFIGVAQKRVLSRGEGQALLKAYVTEWRKFFTQCDYLPIPFRQLETALLNKNPGVGAQISGKKGLTTEDSIVRKLMLDTWNQSIFEDIKIELRDYAMKLIEAERNGETFDSQLVIGVRESYVNLCSNVKDKFQIYREYFEAAYIKTTDVFYRTIINEKLQKNGVLEYMKYADKKLREEEIRAQKYLEPNSGSVVALVKCCERVLIGELSQTILAECTHFIENGETHNLNLMFRLVDRIEDGVKSMLIDLYNHILNTGLADMKENADIITQDSEKYVERLLELFRKFSILIKEAFQDDTRFLTVRDQAYQAVVDDTSVFRLDLPTSINNRNRTTTPESKCPELLANYCDMLLKKSALSKRLTSEQIEARLKDVLLVLKYVKNKDIFMKYHRVYLIKRLIYDTSADSEKEEEMVEWLREIGMPAEYVNRLGRMFQDIKVSQDLNADFKNRASIMYRNQKPYDSINIKILNAGAWAGGNERVPVSLPVDLEDYIPEVEEFYKKAHNGRKLKWYHHMSHGTITFVNEIGKFDLELTTFQIAVLFSWNERPLDKITYENLRLATELPDPELRRTLWSLVASPRTKKQLLLYEPNVLLPKDFTESTQFWVNQKFLLVKNGKEQKRGRINLIGRSLPLSNEQSQIEDNNSIVQLRILRTQEAIIKILKMRKRISMSALQDELIEILKNMFVPSKKMIKEQLEWLIENKYTRRDEKDISTFIYMA